MPARWSWSKFASTLALRGSTRSGLEAIPCNAARLPLIIPHRKPLKECGMRIIKLCVFGLMTTSLATLAAALDLPPPIWSTQPDVNGFEKIENNRLDAAQRSIDKIVAAKGPRTIDNTLRNYDDAVWQINAA